MCIARYISMGLALFLSLLSTNIFSGNYYAAGSPGVNTRFFEQSNRNNRVNFSISVHQNHSRIQIPHFFVPPEKPQQVPVHQNSIQEEIGVVIAPKQLSQQEQVTYALCQQELKKNKFINQKALLDEQEVFWKQSSTTYDHARVAAYQKTKNNYIHSAVNYALSPELQTHIKVTDTQNSTTYHECAGNQLQQALHRELLDLLEETLKLPDNFVLSQKLCALQNSYNPDLPVSLIWYKEQVFESCPLAHAASRSGAVALTSRLLDIG